MPRGGCPPAVRSLAVTVAQQSSARVAPPEPSSTAASVVSTPLIVLTALAVVAGLVLRFVARTPLWLDEALSVNIASLPIGQIPDALRHDGHPPLYYFLLHGWMELFGTTDVAVRALSGVIAVITLPLAWLVGRRRGGPVLGCITLARGGPGAVRVAVRHRDAHVLAGHVPGLRRLPAGRRRACGANDGGWWRLAVIALITAALLYTHYWSMWFLAATFGRARLASLARSTAESRAPARGRCSVAMVVGGLAFLPWLARAASYQSAHTGTPWASPAAADERRWPCTLADFGGGGFRDAEFVGAVLAVLFLLGAVRPGDRSRPHRARPAHRAPVPRSRRWWSGLTLGHRHRRSATPPTSAFASRYAAVVFPLFVLARRGWREPLRRAVGAVRRARGGARALAHGRVLRCDGASAPRRGQIGDGGAPITPQPGDLVVYCPDQLGPSSDRGDARRARPSRLPDLRRPGTGRLGRLRRPVRGGRSRSVRRRGGRARRPRTTGSSSCGAASYRDHRGQVRGARRRAVGRRGPGGQVLVPDGGSKYYEHAQLDCVPSRRRERRRPSTGACAPMTTSPCSRRGSWHGCSLPRRRSWRVVVADRLTPGAHPHQLERGPARLGRHVVPRHRHRRLPRRRRRGPALLPAASRCSGGCSAGRHVARSGPALVIVANVASLVMLVFVRRLVQSEGRSLAVADRGRVADGAVPVGLRARVGLRRGAHAGGRGRWASGPLRKHAGGGRRWPAWSRRAVGHSACALAMPVAIELARAWRTSSTADRVGAARWPCSRRSLGARRVPRVGASRVRRCAPAVHRAGASCGASTINPFARVWEGLGQVCSGRSGSATACTCRSRCCSSPCSCSTFRRWPVCYGAYATVVLVAALSADNLNSLERYGLNAFPLVLTLAVLSGDDRGRPGRARGVRRRVRRAGLAGMARRVRALNLEWPT